MGTVRKTITLTDTQDGWIKAQIDAGHYTNDSEYIRDLIRREQERSAGIEAIRAALIEGEASAMSSAGDYALNGDVNGPCGEEIGHAGLGHAQPGFRRRRAEHARAVFLYFRPVIGENAS